MINLKSLIATTVSEGNNLVQESGLVPGNLTTLGNQFTNESANAIAKFEGSIKGGVDQLSEFKNVATAEINTLKNNVVAETNKITANINGEIAANEFLNNTGLNANNTVVSDIGNGSSSSETFDAGADTSDAGFENADFILDEITVNPIKPNVLEKFVSANYQWTLSALTNEELADPDNTYMKTGPRNIIIKSGGGSNSLGDKKVTTAMEDNLTGRTEMFIEEVNISSIIAPNVRARTFSYHQFSFRVIEPYSMGQFFEALEVGAKRARHFNFIDAPFLMSLDWVGYLQEPSTPGGHDFNDNLGNVARLSQIPGESARHMPIKILDATMSITAKGAEYDVQALAYNTTGLTDLVQQIPIDVAIQGETVEELLQSKALSLTTILNSNLLKREEKDDRVFADEYIILFPTKQESLKAATANANSQMATVPPGSNFSEDELQAIQRQFGEEQFEQILETQSFSFKEWAQKVLGISIKRTRLSDELKADSVTQTNINKIGKSKIVYDTLQDGSQAHSPHGLVYSKDQQVTNQAPIQISKTQREMKFTKGTKIHKIIEEVILSSEYGRGLVDKAIKPNGAKEWFRIESQVYNLPVPEVEAKRGRPPKIYVYRVVPYDVNMSLIDKPTAIGHGEDRLNTQIVKEYNYLYTGENKDVLDFDLNFETRFFTPLPVGRGSSQSDVKNHGSFVNTESMDESGALGVEVTAEEVGDVNNVQGAVRKVGDVSLVNFSSGMRAVPGNEKDEIARTFHNALINHQVDLMELNLKIWGDPYWISDSGMGNYHGEQFSGDKEKFIDSRGQMVYENRELYIRVNFRTPLDYGDNGVAQFNQTAKDNKDKASAELEKFSGIYKCIEIKSSFNQGRFEQELLLLRMRNQARQAVNVKKPNTDKSAGTVATVTDGNSGISGAPHFGGPPR